MLNKLPNFLIVGTAKCGTTSIYNYLKQHPQVFLPRHKEPLFMMSAIYEKLSRKDPRYRISETHTVFSFDDYKKLFEEVKNEKAIGEASTTYLYYHEMAIPNIQKYLGDVKIIISLRNPVDRAYSSYTHLVRDGAETSSFEEFLEKEKERKRENWDILNFPKDLGFYHNQVRAYIDNFTKVKVCLLDDFKKKHVETIQDLYVFLDVEQSFVPDTRTNFNPSGRPKYALADYLLTKDNFLKSLCRPVFSKIVPYEKRSKLNLFLKKKNMIKMKAKTREFLMGAFREDILKLQDLIGRDLSHWLQ